MSDDEAQARALAALIDLDVEARRLKITFTGYRNQFSSYSWEARTWNEAVQLLKAIAKTKRRI